MKRLVRSESGFTLMEAMFAAVAVAICTFFLMDSLVSTESDYEMVSNRLIANQIMQQSVSSLQSFSGMFPYVSGSGNLGGIYVTCSNRKGEATRDANGNVIQVVTFSGTPGSATGKCAGSEVESQFIPSLTDPKQLKVIILFFNRSTGKLISKHEETIRLNRNL